jgi:transaldolase/glucose-6-phosphate isomerase
MNPLLELHTHGQSYWLDNLTREMIENGELGRRVREEGLRGITSNPAIFDKAMSKGTAYDEQIEALAREGLAADAMFGRLAVTDIRDACDILRPVFEESEGVDGFVSLEVSPYLVHDAEATMAEARRLFQAVDRPNLFIKIPGSPAGVPAIEQMLYEGVNINVTLLFSLAAYESVAEAYLRALERRAREQQDLRGVVSVASFFLSRIDVLTDQLLGQRIRIPSATGESPPERLLGRAAVANAKLAYQSFKRLFGGDRWMALAGKGARVQRVLWASTSTKNPLYRDTRYVDPLIGPDTVNTMPDATIQAFAHHGVAASATVEEGVDEAERVMRGLAATGIDFDCVTRQLLDEGMQKFVDPYNELMATLQGKRVAVCGAAAASPHFSGPDDKAPAVLEALAEEQFARRLHARDPSLWTLDPAVAEAVLNRLGWLDCVANARGVIDEINDFARTAKLEGVRSVVLLGMGGSSLCPAVCARVFGPTDAFPELRVLDSTDPAALHALEEQIHPDETLFIAASKSGTTPETLSYYRHFFELLRNAGVSDPGSRFAAITDPGSPLAEEAREQRFRRIFPNQEDIGGRYSALSHFGLVPMALLGMDLRRLLDRAQLQLTSCAAAVPAPSNSGVRLGADLAAHARAGRDKVTFAIDEPIAPFGMWVEQLLAESTGKDGRGLLPVVDEPLGPPDAYGNDRVFVYLSLSEVQGQERVDRLAALEQAGHPVVRIALDDRYDLGAELVRWEVATATAGAVLGVNPFDEPNVTESKRNTRELLERWQRDGDLGEGEPASREGELTAWTGDAEGGEGASPPDLLEALWDGLSAGGYFAVLAYVQQTRDREALLQRLRLLPRDRQQVATTLGYGPRYLHSTGQLHKGGPGTGAYLVLTGDSPDDPGIPGAPYGFATLLRAQALGDFRALKDHGRRVLRIHIGGDFDAGLSALVRRLSRIA